MPSAAIDDEDLALSINPSHTRRGSARSPSEYPHGDPMAESPVGHPGQARDARASHKHRDNGRDKNARNASVRIPTGNMRLGQYTIVRTLGEGSFGKVKLAVHDSSKQKVALKIISRRKLMARDMVGRVEREIQYLQLLRHPHIIKLFTVITTEKEIVMVLEYAGHELFNYLVEHGKMAEDKARTFFQQIICAVEYCHRHKIVHRDLKPENLLLDDNMHVKIADFGLSNIMTDGNFLKTSCGSPNYAAPEVISGKLYAGPEVDVWSCGVILYVLLVGRLPFDDEYIPALFKKIAQGSYHIPQYVSKGAANLVKKMLQVNPVNRITVQEIRQDPWFNKNLADYLKPPVEEFLDTGVDPNKAIDPRSLAPSQPLEVVEKLHASVVGKLGKTMGYAKEDVVQALSVDEPNAIKDAYLIVRENQIMRETRRLIPFSADPASMARDPSLQPFLASSPTAETQSPIASINEALSLPQPVDRPSPARHSSELNAKQVLSPSGRIAVLPSSLPGIHAAYMAGHPKNRAREPTDEEVFSEDAITRARRLNPHSRSQLNIDRLTRPEKLTPVAPPEKKKPKMTKWQFGIRSRNPPAEAMLAIYRALKAMGADWEVPRTRKPGDYGEGADRSARDNDDAGISASSGDESDGDYGKARDNSDDSEDSGSMSPRSVRGRRRQRSHYGSWNDWGYRIPRDPWIINARFQKSDMLPPGTVQSNSTRSSRVDLHSEGQDAERKASASGSATGSTGSVGPAPVSATSPEGLQSLEPTGLDSGYQSLQDAPSLAAKSPPDDGDNSIRSNEAIADDSAHIYLTIQLYAIGTKDQEMYVVDFKCAGYERLVRRLVRNIGEDTDLGLDERSHSGDDSRSRHGSLESGHSERRASHSAADTNSAEDLSAGVTPDDRDLQQDYTSGKPSQGGNWAALKQRQGSRDQHGSSDALPTTDSRDFATGSPGQSRKGSIDAQARHASNPDDDLPFDPHPFITEEVIGDGRAVEEKDVSSPFPFLDAASRLIIQLAEAS